MAISLCGDAYQCLYDYSMSLNRDMAHFTRNYLDSFVNIKAKNKERGNHISLCSYSLLFCHYISSTKTKQKSQVIAGEPEDGSISVFNFAEKYFL